MAKKSSHKSHESIETEILRDAGHFVRDTVKRKVLHIGEISVLILLGFILISFGLANLLAKYFDALAGGYNFILLGVLFLIVSYLIRV
jgi:hypothetical protein